MLDPIGSVFSVFAADQYDLTQVETNGDEFFVIADGDGVFSDAKSARISHSGQVLSPGKITIADGAISADVIWDGTNWLAAYSKVVVTGNYNYLLRGARIAPDGTLLDPAGFDISPGGKWEATVTIAPVSSGGAQVVSHEIVDTQDDSARARMISKASDRRRLFRTGTAVFVSFGRTLVKPRRAHGLERERVPRRLS